MADMNDLAAYNAAQEGAQQAPAENAVASPIVQSEPTIDDLKAYNEQSEPHEPSLFEKTYTGLKEGVKSAARGAVDTAKLGANYQARHLGIKEPFDMPPEAEEAFGEAAASGATLGISRIVQSKILNDQEAQAERAKNNSDIVAFGNTLGGAGLIGLTGGAGSLLEAAGVKGAAKVALAGAADTAILSGGNVVSDTALGDPNVTASKIATALNQNKGAIGMNALLGGSLALGTHGLMSSIKKTGVFKGTIPEAIEAEQSEPAQAPPIEPTAAPIEINPDSPLRQEYDNAIKKTDIAQMEEALKKAKAMGLTTELPAKTAVVDAESRLGDLTVPLNKIQVDSLDSQAARDQLEF